ncbi:glucosidase 2 subunit beta-like isoform X1 [Cynara cardunculus var. scolymus]|uniref:glucosidase 2 subunit beta-like isoform X1 n=1 Tax=Cynara cardunculus var. scolymus TaxID=59895 RepID=UPI000D631432|nr:glucosidase 2 subunit beta-like isoform X1 [Cynara cardunculus var. scolymus]
MKIHTSIVAFFVLSSTLVLRSAAFPSNYLLGVAPEDEIYYKGLWSSGTIKCKDGSKTFTKAQLNDDFCDCFDGTDEPGTSACPAGKFYCRNAGHSPVSIFSSRINDGICDCCDGSDEYDGKNKCKITCWEAGKMVRDRLMKEIATFQEGVGIRAHEVEEAKISAAKDEAELSRLKNEEKILKEIVEKLKERKEQIEKAVEKERIQKEQEEKQKKEAEESESKEHKDEDKVDVPEQEPAENTDDDKAGILDNPPPGQNLKEDPAEPAVEVVHNAYASLDIGEENAAQEEEGSKVAHASDPSTGLGSKGEDATKDIDSLSREELGREIGSRWSGKNHEQQHNDFDDVKNNDETSVNAHDEENDGYDTETDEYHHQHYEEDDTEDQMGDVGDEANDDSSSSYKYEPDDEVDMSDIESTSSPSWFETIQRIVRNFLQAVNPFQTPVDTSEVENVRKEYDEASGKLSKTRSRISRLKKKLGNDFGPEKEFYSLYGQCFESKQNKYVYKVCPFKEATQEEGYSRTLLGQWEKFEESYSVMLFSNGDKCWNGPDRSLKVKLQCGLKVQVADVDEPSRCEYEAMLTAPALCLKGKLKELEDELRALNKEQPQLRDEL